MIIDNGRIKTREQQEKADEMRGNKIMNERQLRILKDLAWVLVGYGLGLIACYLELNLLN